jgi:serine-type D-Ala-D-Ala carboxypeptidase (penicillin-binding protein 5/6)
VNWLAIAILALATLVRLHLPISLQTKLEDQIIPKDTKNRVAQLTAHRSPSVPTKTGTQELALGSASALAWDVDSATPIYKVSSNKQLPIASITKLVTVLVILRDHKLDEVVTIPALPPYQPEEVTLGLTPGQTFVLKDLLAAALIPSANDAADALAIYDSKTIEAFSAKMNRLVSEWGISDTNFNSSSGLVDTNNYATAEALARLASLALTNQTVATLVQTPKTTISDSAGRSYELISTDKLLGDSRVKGVKTGFTAAAGQCFVALVEIKGHRVITVVLGSPDRFAETLTLINWIENNYTWH